MNDVQASMDDTVVAAREVLDTIEQRFGKDVREDAARVIKSSLQLAISTAVACGSLSRELDDGIIDRIRANVCSAIQEGMVTQVYLLVTGHKLDAESARAVTKMVVGQVDRGLARLHNAMGGPA